MMDRTQRKKMQKTLFPEGAPLVKLAAYNVADMQLSALAELRCTVMRYSTGNKLTGLRG